MMSTTPPAEGNSVTVAIAAGGTAGHVGPALVVADQLTVERHRVIFIGTPRGIESRLVPQAGLDLHTFEVGGIPRRIGVGMLKALLRAIVSIPRARTILRAIGPDVVMGGGGYVAGPVAVAAWSLCIPVVLTEADARLGLANRLAGWTARRICCAYAMPELGDKAMTTGRPVARSFFEADREAARAQWSVGPGQLLVTVVGGSGGARRLSRLVWEALSTHVPERVRVVHVTGRRDYAEFATLPTVDRYRLVEYTDEMPTLLAASDLVISRAGGSVFELAAAGVPAVLVPFPFATGDHQRLNAEHFVRAGAAVAYAEPELTAEQLRQTVLELVEDKGRLATMRTAMQSMARPDAATRIAAVVVAQARRR